MTNAVQDVDIFDDLPTAEPVNTQAPETAQAPVAAPQSDADASDADAPTPEWPKIVSEKPADAVTVSEFAASINSDIIRAKAAELIADGVDPVDAAVKAQEAAIGLGNFYQAQRAVRNPLPHYVVRSEETLGDGTTKTNEKVFIPLEIGKEWWVNKPVRGAAPTVARTEEQVETLVLRAGKLRDRLNRPKTGIRARFERVKGQLEKAEKLEERYTRNLAAEGKSWDDAITAFDQWAKDNETAETTDGEDE